MPGDGPAPVLRWKSGAAGAWRCWSEPPRLGRPAARAWMPDEGHPGRNLRCSTVCRTIRCACRGRRRSPPLQAIFDRRPFGRSCERNQAIHQEVLRGRVWWPCTCTPATATCHQHPGQLRPLRDAADGQRRRGAHHGAGARARRRDLRRTRHRHHQAGIPEPKKRCSPFRYKRIADPKGCFQPGQASDASWRLANAGAGYAAMFALSGPTRPASRSRIADHGAERHRRHQPTRQDRLRCGKCKPVCATHCRAPTCSTARATRSRHLAADRGLPLRRADAPRRFSLKHWRNSRTSADHCTVCHKCAVALPGDIDFGDVSMNMRNLLRKMGEKLQAGQCGGDVLPQRHRPAHHQDRAPA